MTVPRSFANSPSKSMTQTEASVAGIQVVTCFLFELLLAILQKALTISAANCCNNLYYMAELVCTEKAGFSIRAGGRQNVPAISYELASYLIEKLPPILRLT